MLRHAIAQLGRRIRRCVLPGATGRSLLGLVVLTTFVFGCVTPITVGEDWFGLGLFRVESQQITDDVAYRQITGVGLLVTGTRVSLGFTDEQLVAARLDDRSYSIDTPLAQIAVGGEADRIALSEDLSFSHTY